MSYYKSSGKFNLGLLIPAIFIGVALTILVAYLYILLGHWISFIILKLLFLLGSVYGVLEITKLSNRIAKNRNQLISYLLTFLFSIILLYFSWFFYVVIELKQLPTRAFHNLWDYVELVLVVQDYTISNPIDWIIDTDVRPENHWITYLVLGGESIALLFGPFISMKFEYFDTMIYCEECNTWAKKWKTIKKQCNKPYTTKQLKEMIDKEDLSLLLGLPDANISNKIIVNIYEISLYRCDQCNQTNYIKIRHNNTSRTGNRNKSIKPTVLLNYYKIKKGKLMEDLDQIKQ